MNAGFKIEGIEALQKVITEAYSGAKAKRIRKEALNAGGDVVVNHLKEKFASFKDTGYSQEEITRTNARSKNDAEELKVGWDGEHGRWRLVHLNEFGYTRMGKQYTPRGFGAIAKSILESQEDYQRVVEGRLKGGL